MNDVDGDNIANADYGDTVKSGPCGACKFLRRKCARNCVFAPHFSSEEGGAKFSSVHKVFGASNATKLLNLVPHNQRREAINSMLYEAQTRLKDPIYGCVGVIVNLQREVRKLQGQISHLKAQKGVINHPAKPPTKATSQCLDLTLQLCIPQSSEAEAESSSKNQPLFTRMHPATDDKQCSGKQVNCDIVPMSSSVRPAIGCSSASSSYFLPTLSSHDRENTKSTLRDILSLSFPVVVQRENEVVSTIKTLLNSANLSLDQRVALTKFKSELSHLINEYQLAESRYKYHDSKIRQRDNDVARVAMIKDAHDKARIKEVELLEDNEKIKQDIEQLQNKIKRNQQVIDNLNAARNEEIPVIKRLKTSLDDTASEVENWLMAKGAAEKIMTDASRKWAAFRSVF